jgi:hypothetical protein
MRPGSFGAFSWLPDGPDCLSETLFALPAFRPPIEVSLLGWDGVGEGISLLTLDTYGSKININGY